MCEQNNRKTERKGRISNKQVASYLPIDVSSLTDFQFLVRAFTEETFSSLPVLSLFLSCNTSVIGLQKFVGTSHTCPFLSVCQFPEAPVLTTRRHKPALPSSIICCSSTAIIVGRCVNGNLFSGIDLLSISSSQLLPRQILHKQTSSVTNLFV